MFHPSGIISALKKKCRHAKWLCVWYHRATSRGYVPVMEQKMCYQLWHIVWKPTWTLPNNTRLKYVIHILTVMKGTRNQDRFWLCCIIIKSIVYKNVHKWSCDKLLPKVMVHDILEKKYCVLFNLFKGNLCHF